jgi:outer membrane protein assembly factor BamD (BamD/ComL family)
MKKSDEKMVEAYYTLGSIYKEQLFNNSKAAETFEEMLQRFPENKYKLSAYYQLYRLYLALGKDSKADFYKNIFLTQYPETEYAKIIRNPGYNAEKQANLSLAEKMYNETYQLYRDSNYLAVIAKCQEADTALGKTALIPKFDLLHALAVGRTQGIDAFESALTRIIIKHPKGDVKDKAQEYLDLIKKQKSGKSVTDSKKDSMINNAVQYLFDKDAEFYWVFIYEASTDIDKIKGQLSNIHSEYYSIDNLKIESIMLDNERHMIYVKSFVGKEKAMTYFNLITKDKKDIFTGLDPGKEKFFVISAENFPLFYKSKNIGEYLAFFQGNFLK